MRFALDRMCAVPLAGMNDYSWASAPMRIRASVRFRRSVILASATLAVCGCDNRPGAAREPLPMYGDFRAFHIVDERSEVARTIDTVFAQFAGTYVVETMALKANGYRVPLVGTSTGQALFAGSTPVIPGGSVEIQTATSRRTVTNFLPLPDTAPDIVAPTQGTPYSSGSTIEIRWTAFDGLSLLVTLNIDRYGVGVGDTLWTRWIDSNVGSAVMPPSVWEGHTDSSAVLGIWSLTEEYGNEFAGTFLMSGGFGVRRRIQIQHPADPPEGTLSGLARHP